LRAVVVFFGTHGALDLAGGLFRARCRCFTLRFTARSAFPKALSTSASTDLALRVTVRFALP